MAQAAAKKAAAARASAISTYRPLLLGLNAIYILLRLRWLSEALQFWQIIGTLVIWILQFVAYNGIIESAANQTKKKESDLAGGVYLDLLGLVVVVQFGSCLLSSKFYWLLAIVPPYGIYKLYSTFKSATPGGMQQQPSEPVSTTTSNESEEVKEKRRKRAERRRQKWS